MPWAVCFALCLIPGALSASHIELVSVADPSFPTPRSGGGASAGSSNGSRTVSSDGRFTVITSVAANLAAGQVDHNRVNDVFLVDHTTGTVTLVSHAVTGAAVAGNGVSDQPVISADGSRVAYVSMATDLVAGQVVGSSPNVFLWDRATGTNALVSHAAGSAVTPASRASGFRPALSQDGHWLLFSSRGADLVPGQNGPAGDSINVFLYDATAGASVLVTHDAAAATTVADGYSEAPVLSADGRYAAYHSSADNLVTGYTNAGGVSANVYLWDRVKKTNTLVSHTAGLPARGGATSQFAAISADGRWIAYNSSETDLVAGVTDTNVRRDVFVYDRDAGTNQLIDHPFGLPATAPPAGADSPVISGDGNWIVFRSFDTSLVAGQTGTGSQLNLFLAERATGNTALITHVAGTATAGAFGFPVSVPAVSDDGRWIAHDNGAADVTSGDGNNKADVFLYDRTTGTNTLVSHRAGTATTGGGDSLGPAISGDGAFVAFASDVIDLDAATFDFNGARDAFLYDRAAGTNALLSRQSAGLPSATPGGDSLFSSNPSPAMSRDGRWVAFTSTAVNLVAGQVDTNGGTDVFLRDRTAGTTTLVSHSAASSTTAGNSTSILPAVSDDGHWVIFVSGATDLVAGQTAGGGSTNIFLFDRLTATISLVSHASASATQGANGRSDFAVLSADGNRIAFESAATNLVAGAAYGSAPFNVFLYDRTAGTTILASHAAGLPLTGANGASSFPRVLADGSGVLFQSAATNLVAGQVDTNADIDVFFFDLSSSAVSLISHVNGNAATAANLGAGYYVVSRDGRFILYDSRSNDIIPGVTDPGGPDVFLYDRQSGASILISHAVGNPSLTVGTISSTADISADGRWLAFTSTAANLVSGQTNDQGFPNVFLHDRLTDETILVSHAAGQPNSNPCCSGGASSPRLSGDGSKVAYFGTFSNLVAGQTNAGGAFLYDRLAGETALVSHVPASPLQNGFGTSGNVEMSGDAGVIVFTSDADDLVANDYNDAHDVFAYTDGLPGAFFTVPPCRLLDTRLPADGPAIFSGQTKIAQAHGVCGIPDTAKALAVNVTIVQPTGAGYLTLHPGDVLPTVTSTINFSAGQTLANNAAQRLAVNTTGTVALTPLVGGNGTVHVVIDVAGYFE